MKKLFFSTCLTVLSCVMSIAQSPLWVVGNQYLVGQAPLNLPTGPTGTNIFEFYQGQPTQYASNAYHNPISGELLFFVVDGFIYDKDGYYMDVMVAASGSGSNFCRGTEEIAIFPDPGSCTRYYIISSAELAHFAGGYNAPINQVATISLLDLAQDNQSYPGRKGALVNISNFPNSPINSITFSNNPENEFFCQQKLVQTKIAVSPLRTDGSRLVFFSNSNGIGARVIDQNGVQGLVATNLTFDIASIVGVPVDYDELVRVRGEMELIKLSNGNYRIAVPYIHIDGFNGIMIPGGDPVTNITEVNIALFIAELNSDGILIAGTDKRIILEHQSQMNQRPYIHGLEFSPNGEFLYVSHVTTNEFLYPLWYYDFNNPNAGYFGLQDMSIDINEISDFAQSHLELASDGFIYMACQNRIARIASPNTPNTPLWTNNVSSITLEPTHFGQYPDGNNPNNHHFMLAKAFKTYSLPDQVDFHNECQIGCYTYACGDGSSDESCCLFYSAFASNSFNNVVVSENIAWEPGGEINGQPIPTGNIPIKIEGNIIIQPGVTLNINNLRVEFSPKSKIIVSRGATTSSAGAQLSVNNSTLTVWENCGECYMWQGVEVSGYAQVASSLPQGKVQFSNNSVVEYAYMGVVNSNMNGTMSGNQDDFSLNPDFNTTGGRISAVQTTFRNNMHDAVFWPYNHSHQSLFDRCLFITNDDLKSDLVSYPIHISTTNNRNIFIIGGRFENETDLVANPQDRGLGILSVNSQVAINIFGTIQATRFNNLESGIYAVSTNSPYSLIVNAAEFNNNINGIYARGENRTIILNSEFRVFRALNSQATYGILFDGCNAYRVEDNVFTGVNPLSSNNHNNFGALVANSGPYANVIEKNDFTNLRVGTSATGVNAENYFFIDLTNPPKGLQWLCNTFSDNVDDIVVRNGTIAPHQGNCFNMVIPPSINIDIMRPTGNIFLTNSAGNYHISMSANVPAIKYFYNDLAAFNEPLTYTSNVTPIPCIPNPDDLICGRTYRENQGQGLTLSDLIDKRGEYFDERALIEEHIDFGNRDSVLLQVLDPYISASEKRDMLNSGITTVSDEVLINYMNSNPPSNMLYQVLQHNSPLSDKVIYVMMEAADMPNGMKQQILLIQSGLSNYEASSQVLQEIQLELNAIESDIIELYLTDSTGVYSIMDVVTMYENTPIKDKLYQERLFAAYVGANMSNEADSLANILKTNKNDVNYSFFMDLTVQSISMNYFDILSSDSTIIENLEMLAESDDYYYAPRARAILSGYLGYKFDIELPEESGTKSMQIPQYTYDGSIYEPITVFPNPASDHFFIVFEENADVSQNREARIYDLAGNLQFTRSFDDNAYVLDINTVNMTQGMYIVVISANGVDVGTYKVAVR